VQRFATIGARRDWRRGVVCGCAVVVGSLWEPRTVPVLLIGLAMIVLSATSVRREGVYVTDLGVRRGPERWRRTIPWNEVERFELLDRRSNTVLLHRRNRRPVAVSARDWWWAFGRRRGLERQSATQLVAALNALVVQHRG
jgi:hypothetical protein